MHRGGRANPVRPTPPSAAERATTRDVIRPYNNTHETGGMDGLVAPLVERDRLLLGRGGPYPDGQIRAVQPNRGAAGMRRKAGPDVLSQRRW